MKTTGLGQLIGQSLWRATKASFEAVGYMAGKAVDIGTPVVKGVGYVTGGVAKGLYNPLKKATLAVGANFTDKGALYGQAMGIARTAKLASPLVSRTEGEVVHNIATGMKEFKESELQLSSLGKGLIAGAYLFQGSRNSADEYIAEKMGQIDEHKRTNTPIFGNSRPITPYSGGADGSLVFALHNNR